MSKKDKFPSTTIINKYPTHRDEVIKACWKWLKGRRADDNAEGLWRVHDKLYDLTNFVERHPGGKEWLVLTKGTDITEAFESNHIRNIAEKTLTKFFVRDASEPRNYKFTFHENGFYRTLKRKVADKLSNLDTSKVWRSELILDVDLLLIFVTAVLAVRIENIFAKVVLVLMSAQCMAWLNAISHNFIHKPNNWRMYTACMTFIGWRDWRVFHALSHHPYPNTYTDFEIIMFEPMFKWMPEQTKTRTSLLLTYLMMPFVYTAMFHLAFLSRSVGYLYEFSFAIWEELIPLLLPTIMFLLGDVPFTIFGAFEVIVTWFAIMFAASFLNVLVAINAGHHGPRRVHEGDEIKDLDFGIYQMSATINREEADYSLLTTLLYYGDHTLHHMFPTLDHSLLVQLRDVYAETCLEFQAELQKCTQLEALVGQFQQLRRSETFKLDEKT